MGEQGRRLTYSGKSFLLLIALIAAGFAGNFFSLRLFTGFNFLFGSIAVLLTVRLFGIRWGLVAGLAASLWTIKLYGHPFAVIWLCGEPLFVGWLLHKGKKHNVLLCDAFYWPLVGAPLVWLIFRYVMHVTALGAVAAMLTYWVVGITNALVAGLLLAYIPRIAPLYGLDMSRTIPIHHLIFNILMAVVLIPSIVVMVIYGKGAENRYLKEMYAGIDDSLKVAGYETRIKLQELAVEASGTSMPDKEVVGVLRGILLDARGSQRRRITLIDGSGKVITGTDDAPGDVSSFEPCRGGTPEPVGESGIYRCMPTLDRPVPLLQRMHDATFFRRAPLGGGTTWSMAVEFPFAPYQRALLHDHIESLVIVLCLNMFVLVTSLSVSHRLAAPLYRLSQVTTDLPKRLLRENISAWPESMVSEIDQLIGNFKVMSIALSQRFQEITYNNEALEHHVAERTGELTRTNAELQKEIAERRMTERQRDALMVELQKKNRELEGIVYVASHDLRSPLVNVQGFSRKLAKSCVELDEFMAGLGLDASEQARIEPILRESIPKSLGFITRSIEKMDSLLGGLLRLSRMGRTAVCFETLDMRFLISNIIASITYQIESAGARVEVNPSLDPCLGDSVQVTQIFSNLLDNALKYSAADRPLVVHIASEEFEEGVRYCVEDNGIGIPHDQQDKIWEIFHRLNPGDTQGEGLGLTMARRIADRMGGSIWVESEPAMGSRFYVVLPCAPQPDENLTAGA
ncbi:MAG: HAMP domain-containing sensor histidine kinase [Oryzomonas sp.]|uniref:sensor histidine kinase n=1 Tax=Oryzomonas sp. TaxID=2855186 RepID=UPI00284A2D3D|nr:HAMP domain-containing sensor histidine kinase [Oryzomonas sp.]MDR3579199.1 HAMP domain-containing sensor histidine kinase [Oryzomonas sp.]